ncbi:MAG: acyltransferase [Anaerolineae bacterium]|nr:acyltransferase family protein [Anaerolineales bacterium]MCQ3972644.1 acyltransferase [Anaerolineae bacterium]
MTQLNPNSTTLSRRWDIDWLRVLATLAVFLFHCARFFNDEGWHIKNNQLDLGMTIFVNIVSQWLMPLFFILSGSSVYYALVGRRSGVFVRERVTRLLLPLIFGMLVLIPPQVYIESVSGQSETVPPFAGSFLEFYPHYFDGFYAFGGYFAWMGLHLWYLLVLSIFSLLTLPLFIFLKTATGQRLVAGLSAGLAKPGLFLLLPAPLIIFEAGLDPEGLGLRAFGGWSLWIYLSWLIIGYVLAAEPHFQQAIRRHFFAAIGLGVLTLTLGLNLYYGGISAPYGSLNYVLLMTLRVFNSWFWLLAILGLGQRYFTFKNDFLAYTSEASLPFYMLHQSVIVVIGFFMRDWALGVLPKYVILAVVSFMIIMVLYELLIRRFNALRFLFGLKSRQLSQSTLIAQPKKQVV